MDIGPYLGPVATVAIAILGFYGMVSSRLARIETKMDDLSEDVRKHNGIVERVAILERDTKTLWRTLNEVKEKTR